MLFDWVAFWKYTGVVTTLIAAGFGAPIPEEIPIVTAGAMVGHDAQERYHDLMAGAIGGGPAYVLTPHPTGLTRWWIMLPLCIVGVVVADTVLYAAGRLFGAQLLHSSWFRRRILPDDKRLLIEQNFHNRGVLILLGARFTPGIRTPVFIMSGILRMPLGRFLLADGLYAIPGVNLLFWLAYLFTDQFVEAVEAVDRHRPLVAVAVLSALLGIILYKFLTSRTLSTGDPEQIPLLAKPVGVVTHAVEQTIERAVEKTVDVLDKVTHPFGHGDSGSGPGLRPEIADSENQEPLSKTVVQESREH